MAENLSHQSPDWNPETTENDLSLLTQEANQLQKEVQQWPNERIKKVNQKLIDRKMNPAAEKIKEVIESVGSADKERREIRDQWGFKFNLIEDTL